MIPHPGRNSKSLIFAKSCISNDVEVNMQDSYHNHAMKKNDNKNILPSQQNKWDVNLQKLVNFTDKFKTFPNIHSCSDKLLLGWIKRQRCQYKCFVKGKKSTMTEKRVQKLNDIGFVWDYQEYLWQRRFNELLEFKFMNGDCSVPSNFPKNPQLATWVKCQRRQYQLFKQGQASDIARIRIEQLEKLGFQWSSREASYEKVPSVHRRSQHFNHVSCMKDKPSDDDGLNLCNGQDAIMPPKANADNMIRNREMWSEILSDLSDLSD